MDRQEQYQQAAWSEGRRRGVAAARSGQSGQMPNFRNEFDDSLVLSVEDGWRDGYDWVKGGSKHIPARDKHRRKDVVRKGSKWESIR